MRRSLLWGLFFLALAIRVTGISNESVWYDEAFTAHIAKLPLPDMLTAIRGDVHPPLFYMLEWLIARVTTEAWALRLPSAVFSAAASVEMLLLVKQLAGERAGWTSALLYLAMPGQMYYGQEARMYSLLTLLVMMAGRAALERNWWRFAPALGLIMYTQNMGVFYAASLGLLALWSGGRRAILPGMAGGASWLVWLPTMLQQASDVKDGFWVAPGELGGTLYYLFFSTFYARVPYWGFIHSSALAIGFTLISVYVLRKEWRKYIPLALIAFAPVAFLYIVHTTWRPIMIPRILIPSGAAVIGLWGVALAKLKPGPRWAALAAIVPMTGMSLWSFYFNAGITRFDLRPGTEIVSDNWQSGDAIYNLNLDTMITYGYYLPYDEYPTYALPHAGDLAQSLTDETKVAMRLKQREMSIDTLADQGYRRVWLLYADSPVVSDGELAQARAILDRYPILATYPIFDDSLDVFTIYLIDLQG